MLSICFSLEYLLKSVSIIQNLKQNFKFVCVCTHTCMCFIWENVLEMIYLQQLNYFFNSKISYGKHRQIRSLRQQQSQMNVIPGIIHRKACLTKQLMPEVHQMLQDGILWVNFIKIKPLKQSRVFVTLCGEMDRDPENLL